MFQVNFTAWAPGKPDNNNGTEDCVAVGHVQNFLWDDYPCNADDRIAYICEKTGMYPQQNYRKTTSNW